MIPAAWRRAAAGIVLSACGALVWFAARTTPSPPAGADARIEWYRARLGGPGTYPAYARLGAAYLEKAQESGREEFFFEAETNLRESLVRQPNFEALHWLSTALLAQHRFAEALATARQAADTMPGSVESHALIFDSHLALGEIEAAAGAAERLMNMLPGFAAWTRQAALEEARGNLPAAGPGLTRACAAAAWEQRGAATLAWCDVRQGSLTLDRCDPAGAEQFYQSALRRQPGYFLAREHLAELRAAQGRTGDAAQLYDALIPETRNPLHLLARAQLNEFAGRAADAAHDREAAIAALRKSAAGTSRAAWRPLALALLESESTRAEAQSWAEKDFENRRDFGAYVVLADALLRNARRQEAAAKLAQGLHKGNGDTELTLRAARVLLELGENEQARKILAPALTCSRALSPAARRLAEVLASALKP